MRYDGGSGTARVAADQISGLGPIVTVSSLTCLVAAVMVALDLHTVVRAPVVLVAMVVGPGWVPTSFLRIRESGFLWAVAISVGLSVNVALGLALIALGSWHPIGASLALLLGSGVVLGARSVSIALRTLSRGAT
jgi:hypothetical protein